MTEALRAAIEALDETDHTRLPAQMVAEIVLSRRCNRTPPPD